MILSFDLEQNITLDELYINDNSSYEDDENVLSYTIEYTSYLGGESDPKYTCVVDDVAMLDSIKTGLYIPIGYFIDESSGLAAVELSDDAYYFSINVNYNTDLEFDLNEYVDIYLGFFQGVLNIYSQVHLEYNWTKRYKEMPKEFLQIAEELTWIDSLRLASDNESRLEEFKFILGNLEKYFTLRYDY